MNRPLGGLAIVGPEHAIAARRRWNRGAAPSGMIPARLPPGGSESFAPLMGTVPATQILPTPARPTNAKSSKKQPSTITATAASSIVPA